MVSRRITDQLSPYHDSQFSAFSIEVLDRTSQKHNRSSSPFTTLAEQVERKVVITGAGQPKYWPKTRFRADTYNAIFGIPKYTLEVFGHFGNMYGWIEPLAFEPYRSIYGNPTQRRYTDLWNKPIPNKGWWKTVSIIIWLIRQNVLL